jgi:hypothetical protein
MDDESDTALVPVTPYLNLPSFMAKSYFEGLDHVTGKANEKQPPRQGEFTQRAASLHEASHCVIARLEGKNLSPRRSIGRKVTGSANTCSPGSRNSGGNETMNKYSAISVLRWPAGEANYCSKQSFACGRVSTS